MNTKFQERAEHLAQRAGALRDEAQRFCNFRPVPQALLWLDDAQQLIQELLVALEESTVENITLETSR